MAARLALLILIVACAHSRARADSPDEEEVEPLLEELFLGDTAYLQEAGELQGTLALSHEGGSEQSSTVSLAAELGLTDWWQVEVVVPARAVWDEAVGLGRIEAEVAFGAPIAREPELLFAASLAAIFPPLPSELDEAAYGIEPGLVLHAGIGPLRLVLGGGLEVGFPVEENEEPEVGGEATFGAFFRAGPVVPTIEVRGEMGEERELRVALGLACAIAESLELGIAGYGGADDEGAIYGGSVVLSIEAPLFGEAEAP